MSYSHEREFAKINSYGTSGRRMWSSTLDDWVYGDTFESKEEIGFIRSDASGNAYCSTQAVYKALDVTHTYRRIIKFSSSGTRLWTVSQEITDESPGLLNDAIITVASSGFLVFVFNAGHIIALSPAGVALWEKTTFGAISGLKIGDDGFIYVSDDTGVIKLSIDGDTVWTAAISGGGE